MRLNVSLPAASLKQSYDTIPQMSMGQAAARKIDKTAVSISSWAYLKMAKKMKLKWPSYHLPQGQ